MIELSKKVLEPKYVAIDGRKFESNFDASYHSRKIIEEELYNEFRSKLVNNVSIHKNSISPILNYNISLDSTIKDMLKIHSRLESKLYPLPVTLLEDLSYSVNMIKKDFLEKLKNSDYFKV